MKGNGRERKEELLRAAMDRLLTGRPIHTDGTLDATTLAVEAGLSRQDLYRTYRALLDEFQGHVARVQASGAPTDRRTAQIKRLTERLDVATERAGRYREERDQARRERDSNASQVVYFERQNSMLRENLRPASDSSPASLHRTPF